MSAARPSRKAATAALAAHVAVLKGRPLRQAIAAALAEQQGLGGQERRFAAFAARELSRHQRWLDLHARLLGLPPAGQPLLEDQALVRYALWRRLLTGADERRVMAEVKLPGPLRPRSVKDQTLQRLLSAPVPDLPAAGSPVERAATRHSFPRWLAERIARAVPEEEVDALFAALNREPALILRVRHPDAERSLAEEESLRVERLPEAPGAIRVDSHRVFESAAMKRGWLQVQDLGSQLIVEHCGALEGLAVADVCAGAGGKTIALADRAARVLAGDASARRLSEARRRVAELGLKNVSFSVPARCEEADVVLVDAPCSGTGSLHREPDRKWRLTAGEVDRMVVAQAEILDDVAARAGKARVLVYATCSLLREENEEQVAAFVRRHPEWAEDGPPLRVLPHRMPGGAFFAARLRRSR
jgi:16S rRNA (cytosine967-C5)-methyltransferase